MADRTTVAERETKTPLPYREFIVGIYREKGQLVVRKFEQKGMIRIPLDEQFALNDTDAVIIQNILFHEIHKHRLN